MTDISDQMLQMRDRIHELQEMAAATQAMLIPTRRIVWEMTADLARLHPSPEQYISDLFNRVFMSLEWEAGSLDREAGLIPSRARQEIEALFGELSSRLRT